MGGLFDDRCLRALKDLLKVGLGRRESARKGAPKKSERTVGESME